MPKGEEEKQEIENLFEKIMKENFSNLAKEVDIQVQDTQREPNKSDQRGAYQDTSLLKCQRLKINRES